MSHKHYRIVARTWALIFVVVGILFVFAPEQTGKVLTALAHRVGLAGEIEAPPNNLWHVLALSLMAAVSTLALLSAQDPSNDGLYLSLLVAKITSTTGFIFLAFQQGPAWAICAIGDGFVAATLFLSRERSRGFLQRWLLQAGVDPSRVEQLTKRARERAQRYDAPFRWLYPALVLLLDWCSPLLAMGRLRRARSLRPDEFDRLIDALKGHRIVAIRLLATFSLAPLMEVVTEESAPPKKAHPLASRLSTNGQGTHEFDVVVIGSGAGGAPLASTLSERGLRVAIIEKGDLVTPDAAPRVIEKHYIGQGMTGALGHDGSMLVLAGSAVGGTTPINSGTCLKPLVECLHEWDKDLGQHFAEGQLDPWLDQAWSDCGVTVPPRSLLSASGRIMEEGLQKLGRNDTYVLPRNAPDCRGSGRCCFGCPTGAKQSVDMSFLPRAIDAGAKLFAHTVAREIEERAGEVHIHTDRQGTFHARHLVIAGGALATPGLLHRNRLGSAWQKTGDHLKVHPATKVFAHVPGLKHGEGGIPQGLGYRPPELPRITLEGIHTPRSVVGPILMGSSAQWRWWMERMDETASFGLMMRDRATGRVSKRGIQYTLDSEDAHDIGAAILLLAEAFFAAGADRVMLPVAGMPAEVDSLSALRRLSPKDFRRDHLTLCGFHPQGTAGMGRVVDTDLRLLKTERISVCDASVLPDSPGVNPQITIMALSLRLADRLLSEQGPVETWTSRRGMSISHALPS